MLEEVMLEAGVVHTIFPCLDQLLELHTNFLEDLLDRRTCGQLDDTSNNFIVRRIGDLLLRQVRDGRQDSTQETVDRTEDGTQKTGNRTGHIAGDQTQ